MVHLDFSEAFDKVDRGVLLHKMHALGITGRVVDWIASFLSD